MSHCFPAPSLYLLACVPLLPSETTPSKEDSRIWGFDSILSNFLFGSFTYKYFHTGGYDNSAIEKRTPHVNNSLQDFNSGIPLCFKAGLEMNFIDMHHQIQFSLSRGMVWFQTLTKALLTPRKQQGCPMSTNLVPQLCFVPSSSEIDFPLGTLALWHLGILAYYKHTSYLSRKPREFSCNFFLAGVNFYRFNAKNWQFTVYFAVITQKIGNFLCILS